MKRGFKCILMVFMVLMLYASCAPEKNEQLPLPKLDWSGKTTSLPVSDSLKYGKTYLSVYSQIYSYTEHTALDLTATVSIRNTSELDAVYLVKADYYDTAGNLIQSYVEDPIRVNQMETLEIVIAEVDKKGGTGANFIFEWAAKPKTSSPIFEAVMISTYGQQGLSFMTHGLLIE